MGQQKIYIEGTKKSIKAGLLVSRIFLCLGVFLLCTPLWSFGLGVIVGSITMIAWYQLQKWWHHS